MKLIVTLAAICWLMPLSQIARQPSKGITKKEGRTDTQLSTDARDKQQAAETAALNQILAAITKNEQERANERQQEAADVQKTISAEWWLVYVGIAQAIALIFTLLAIWYQASQTRIAADATRDAAKAAAGSVEAINRQAVIMERQTAIAEKTAEAAQQNIEIFIGKERARLRVTLKPLVLSTQKLEETYIVEFTVKNCGPTTAFITRSSCVVLYGPKEMVETGEEMGAAIMFPIHNLPSEMSDNMPIETFTFLFFQNNVSSVLSEIRERRFFVGIRGSITYHDVFEKERITAFRYIWELSGFAGIIGGDPYSGNWIRCGSPEDNKET